MLTKHMTQGTIKAVSPRIQAEIERRKRSGQQPRDVQREYSNLLVEKKRLNASSQRDRNRMPNDEAERRSEQLAQQINFLQQVHGAWVNEGWSKSFYPGVRIIVKSMRRYGVIKECGEADGVRWYKGVETDADGNEIKGTAFVSTEEDLQVRSNKAYKRRVKATKDIGFRQKLGEAIRYGEGLLSSSDPEQFSGYYVPLMRLRHYVQAISRRAESASARQWAAAIDNQLDSVFHPHYNELMHDTDSRFGAFDVQKARRHAQAILGVLRGLQSTRSMKAAIKEAYPLRKIVSKIRMVVNADVKLSDRILADLQGFVQDGLTTPGLEKRYYRAIQDIQHTIGAARNNLALGKELNARTNLRKAMNDGVVALNVQGPKMPPPGQSPMSQQRHPTRSSGFKRPAKRYGSEATKGRAELQELQGELLRLADGIAGDANGYKEDPTDTGWWKPRVAKHLAQLNTIQGYGFLQQYPDVVQYIKRAHFIFTQFLSTPDAPGRYRYLLAASDNLSEAETRVRIAISDSRYGPSRQQPRKPERL